MSFMERTENAEWLMQAFTSEYKDELNTSKGYHTPRTRSGPQNIGRLLKVSCQMLCPMSQDSKQQGTNVVSQHLLPMHHKEQKRCLPSNSARQSLST
jgi:hypothetical protein